MSFTGSLYKAGMELESTHIKRKVLAVHCNWQMNMCLCINIMCIYVCVCICVNTRFIRVYYMYKYNFFR